MQGFILWGAVADGLETLPSCQLKNEGGGGFFTTSSRCAGLGTTDFHQDGLDTNPTLYQNQAEGQNIFVE